ncbi:DUF418 domain-containing protein [Aquimarina sediminis]|uniref:DUF418 domain-containing protein n=1 Tax=Aquimarina sediminis TaxID=2070536 RepID=UPI000CA03357|nr:DUF418 domain-containing protein [Aquimarina sediminis]
MQNRIIGIDVARAFAIFGMIIVNFKMTFGNYGNQGLATILNILDGKAASTFVVLAGVGIALMSKGSLQNYNLAGILKIKKKLFKKALFLFLVGLSYSLIWPADILHFYGVYMLLAIVLLRSTQTVLMLFSASLIVLYPILMIIWDYDIGWDYTVMEYEDLWTTAGFFRNLFFNGFHPVIPWSAFMLIGMWFGKMELDNNDTVKKAIWVSFSVFICAQFVSYFSMLCIPEGGQETRIELISILGTKPMPPLPLYMISGSSIAIFTISVCILVSKKYKKSKAIQVLKNTGQLALTFYIAHVVLGIGIVEAIGVTEMGQYSINFSFFFALLFIVGCIIFSIIVKKYMKHGPIEWVMRKLTN